MDSLYYNYLINDGGPFNINGKFNGYTTDNQHNGFLNNTAFAKPSFISISGDSLDPFVAQQQKAHIFQNFHACSSTMNHLVNDVNREHSENLLTIETKKEQKKVTLYKTEICRNWEELGSCR